MRAVLSKAPGGPETLVVEEVLDPTPKAGEVIIEVKAVGINYPDTLIIEDRYQFRPERPFAPGAEVATSGTLPMPTVWWLRPVSMAARVGAQSAVVWKRL